MITTIIITIMIITIIITYYYHHYQLLHVLDLFFLAYHDDHPLVSLTHYLYHISCQYIILSYHYLPYRHIFLYIYTQYLGKL